MWLACQSERKTLQMRAQTLTNKSRTDWVMCTGQYAQFRHARESVCANDCKHTHEQTVYRGWEAGSPDILNRSRLSVEQYKRTSWSWNSEESLDDDALFKWIKLCTNVKTCKNCTAQSAQKLQNITGGRHQRCRPTHNLSMIQAKQAQLRAGSNQFVLEQTQYKGVL